MSKTFLDQRDGLSKVTHKNDGSGRALHGDPRITVRQLRREWYAVKCRLCLVHAPVRFRAEPVPVELKTVESEAFRDFEKNLRRLIEISRIPNHLLSAGPRLQEPTRWEVERAQWWWGR